LAKKLFQANIVVAHQGVWARHQGVLGEIKGLLREAAEQLPHLPHLL
jgi:hypothetical protein